MPKKKFNTTKSRLLYGDTILKISSVKVHVNMWREVVFAGAEAAEAAHADEGSDAAAEVLL